MREPSDRNVQHAVQSLGEVFGHDTVAAAMIDRVVRRADIVPSNGDPLRLKDRDLGCTPPATRTN